MKYLVIAVCVGTAMARPDGAGGHHHDHGHDHGHAPAAPAPSGYQEPHNSYQEPSTGYDQPSGYAAPSGYEQPGYDTGYGATGYGTGYGVVEEDDGGFDPKLLIIPVLIIAGLALLFPQVVRVDVNDRKKRSAEDEISGNSLAERVQDIYMSVLESEECMERVACEVGGIVTDAGISKNIFNAAEAFVPKKYSKLMKRFNVAKDCHTIKCGTMF